MATDLATHPILSESRRELLQRGLPAWDAYVCCVKARNIATAYIDEVASNIVQMWDGGEATKESAVFPFMVPLTFLLMLPKRFQVKPVRWPGGVWTIVIVIWTLTQEPDVWREDGKWEMPMGWAEANTVAQPLQAAARALRRRTDGDCFRCVFSKVWSQKKLRRTVTILSSSNLASRSGTRPIGDRKLNLRTPHR